MDAPKKTTGQDRQQAAGQQRPIGVSAEAAENRAHRLLAEMQAMVAFFGDETRRLVAENMALREELAKCKSGSSPIASSGTTAPAGTLPQT